MKEQLKNWMVSLEIRDEIIENILNTELFDDFVPKSEITELVTEKTKNYVLDSEISHKLTKANAKNMTACRSLIDSSTLDFDGEKITGLDEQIEKITRQNPYLFEDFSYTPTSGTNKPSEQNMTDSEYFNYLKLNNNGGF
ncbi:MAG: phage scaffolding protein [Clostridia bacterium]